MVTRPHATWEPLLGQTRREPHMAAG